MILPIRITMAILICLVCLPVVGDDRLRARNDAIIVRAIERMHGYDYSNDQHVMAAIARHMARSEGTAEYLKLARRFRPESMPEKLQEMLLGEVSQSLQVEAAGLLCQIDDGPKQLRQLLDRDPQTAARLATILGLLGNGRAINILSDVAKDRERPFEVRRCAVVGLARNKSGRQALLGLAESNRLAADTRLLAGGLLARLGAQDVRRRAAEVLPQPQQKDRKPLAPIDQLASMKGDADTGRKLFRGVATCANCHVVGQHGKNVGPNLSEIGSKLSREAMFTSILDPNAGISHNYENYIVLTASGQVINGLKVSETSRELVIRTADAIDRNIQQDDIEQVKKSETSIMPENLHHTVDQEGLVDIVEYMTTLRKSG